MKPNAEGTRVFLIFYCGDRSHPEKALTGAVRSRVKKKKEKENFREIRRGMRKKLFITPQLSEKMPEGTGAERIRAFAKGGTVCTDPI